MPLGFLERTGKASGYPATVQFRPDAIGRGRDDEALALIERVVQADSPYAAAARETCELMVQRMAKKNR